MDGDRTGRRRLAALLRYLRAHRLVVGFVAAMAPLATLMALQVVWLTDLDRASALAHRAALRNCLEAIGNEVSYFYRSTAERLLNVPSSLFEGGDRAKLADYWAKRPRAGVRRLFVVDYVRSETGNFYTFVPEQARLVSTEASDEALAIVIAALPFQRWAQRPGIPGGQDILHVSEQDPDHRLVFKPVVDKEERTVGLVGLVVDLGYVRSALLEEVVERVVPTFFGDEEEWPILRVADGRGRAAYGPGEEIAGQGSVAHQMSFVLRDWVIHAARSDPNRNLASGSLAYNLALGFAVAVALAAGVMVALLGARDAMRLSQMKSDFVSNVSHELRTPVASIRLFAEMLKRGRTLDADKVIQYGTHIEAESRRLSRLIDNILDFSRIESEQKEYRLEPTRVLEVVRPVLDAVEARRPQTGLRLVRDLPQDPGPLAWLDADAIGQALFNLLDNAIKYSEGADEIVVHVRAERGQAAIAVEDHGIGIAKKDQAKVFDRFHRVGTGLVHDVKGSGLGLAIVAHVARAHGGRVSVDSELGRGSTFTLWLPLCHEEEASDGRDPDRRR